MWDEADAGIREAALGHAIHLAVEFSTGATAPDIVKDAEKFYKFLMKGNNTNGN